MRILFVENQETFARVVIGAFLKGHEVAVRTSLSGAIEELDAAEYDAALVSFQVDDGTGTELVRFIRQSGSEMLIIGISAKDEENEWLMTAGADDTCSKMRFEQIGQVLDRHKTK